jgi:hypothetical protein
VIDITAIDDIGRWAVLRAGGLDRAEAEALLGPISSARR